MSPEARAPPRRRKPSLRPAGISSPVYHPLPADADEGGKGGGKGKGRGKGEGAARAAPVLGGAQHRAALATVASACRLGGALRHRRRCHLGAPYSTLYG